MQPLPDSCIDHKHHHEPPKNAAVIRDGYLYRLVDNLSAGVDPYFVIDFLHVPREDPDAAVAVEAVDRIRKDGTVYQDSGQGGLESVLAGSGLRLAGV